MGDLKISHLRLEGPLKVVCLGVPGRVVVDHNKILIGTVVPRNFRKRLVLAFRVMFGKVSAVQDPPGLVEGIIKIGEDSLESMRHE